MIPPRYRFYLELNGIKTEVTPHYKKLNKKYAKESGQEFFRCSLEGKISLHGKDFDLVNTSSINSIFTFIMEKFSEKTGRWVEYFRGEFGKMDCKINAEKKKCELKINAKDAYSKIMDRYEDNYDLIKLAPKISRINMSKRSLMQVYVAGSNSITNFFGGTYWESDVNEAIDNRSDLMHKYYFSYVETGNEFYIKGAKIPGVNGVYAGTDGWWDQWNGHACYIGPIRNDVADILIKRHSDNKILYKSEKKFRFMFPEDKCIKEENVVMVNVEDSSDRFTILSPFVYQVFERLLCDVDTIEDSQGVKQTYDLPINDFVSDNRNYKKCIGLQAGLVFCSSKAVSTPTKYGINDYNEYFTNKIYAPSAGIGRLMPISKNSWANASLWFAYGYGYEQIEPRLRKPFVLRDSYSIGAAIEAILKKIDPNIQHKPTPEYSEFLYGKTNPLGLDRFFVYIAPKTNILKGNYDQPAKKAESSLESLMGMLRDCFKCYWYIEDNKLKIEHISFFIKGGTYGNAESVQYDFTKLKDQFNRMPVSYFQSEIEYDKSDMAHRYEFSWMDEATELFTDIAIDVDSAYVEHDKTEEISANQFSSDVDFMMFNPSGFSNDGFALLCPIREKAGAQFIEIYTLKDAPHKGFGISEADGKKVEVKNTAASDFIRLEENRDTYSIKANVPSGYGIAFYSEPTEESFIPIATPGDIPADAKYFRFCMFFVNVPLFGAVYIGASKFKYSIPIEMVQSIKDEDYTSYDATIQNWYASWLYLVRLYMYDMPGFSISCNKVSPSVKYIKKCMKHSIEFLSEEDLDSLKLIKTQYGLGKIDEFSIDVDTRNVKAKLVYEPK